MTDPLTSLGVTPSIIEQSRLDTDLSLGRVIAQHHHLYDVKTASSTVKAQLSGKLSYDSEHPMAYPAVGDWVMIDSILHDQDHYMIHKILNRKTLLRRNAADNSHQLQVMVANVDIAFICMSVNRDYNLRRLERYLAMVWDSHITPVIILTKADLSDDISRLLSEVQDIAPDVEIVVSDPNDKDVITQIRAYLKPHRTAVLLGSSGVGKSTLTNKLIHETQVPTKPIRQDGKGRHTTTTRQIFEVPSGGVIIDTPGLRALQITVSNLSQTFQDISNLIAQCQFKNCQHLTEPKCAIQNALSTGELSTERWQGYQKIQKEQHYSTLNAKEIESEKINSMFGGKKAYKQKMAYIRSKNKKY